VVRKFGSIALISISMAAAAVPVQAEVKDASPSGFTLENSAVVPVDAMSAWQALVGSVDSWWPKDHTWWGRAPSGIEPVVTRRRT
jgi:hypothetical protein